MDSTKTPLDIHELLSRARQLLVAVYGGGIWWIMIQLAGVVGVFAFGMHYRIEIHYAAPPEAGIESLAPLADSLAVAYPEAEIAVRHLELAQESGEHCGDSPLALTAEIQSGRWKKNKLFQLIISQNGDGRLRTCYNSAMASLPENWRGTLLHGAVPVAVVLLLLLLRARADARRRAFWLDWKVRVSLARAAIVGLITMAMMLGMVQVLAWGATGLGFELPDIDTARLSGGQLWMMAPTMILAAPFVEEYAFRAWMLERAGRAIGSPMALVLSTAIFVAIHFPGNIWHGILLLIPGLALGLLWLRTRSLLACVVAHAGYNAVVLVNGAMAG